MEELIRLVSKTFDMEPEEIDLDMNPSDIDAWDSLGQLLLINNIEDNYNIILEIEEIFGIMKIRDVLDILKAKGKIK